MNRLQAFQSGTLALARETESFAYSHVALGEHRESHLCVISSEEPVPFAAMVDYFTQADPFEAFIERHALEAVSPLTWYYLNRPEQPRDPGGNPVREPFLFQVGYEVRAPERELREASGSVGWYITRPLRALSVASVIYRGSFPHQENSAFGEAWMTLVSSAPELGYSLTGSLYREIYHHLDDSDPSRSVTEIQVEVS